MKNIYSRLGENICIPYIHQRTRYQEYANKFYKSIQKHRQFNRKMGLNHEYHVTEKQIYIANKHMKRSFGFNNDQRITYHAIMSSILHSFDWKHKIKSSLDRAIKRM